jgi:23S rRNA pseudouridine2605 synthase
MAKSRSTPSRAPSSASGRRQAGSRDAAKGGASGSSKRSTSKRPASKRPASNDAGPKRTSGKRPGKSKPQPFAVNEREQQEGVRLQKFMASAGVSSRRRAEELITSGLVSVNGQRVTELGTRVFPGRDRVTVRGEPIRAEDKVYFVLNKPDEMVCSAAGSVDERGRPTVLSLMHGIPQRLYPVGRLDYHSRGVLILTNDGELAAALTHPRHGVVKTYHVKFQGKLSPDEEDALREGVELDDGAVTRPLAELFAFRETDTNCWYQIGLTEGLNRQIRRMGDAIGHPVLKLIRVAIGDITADGLEEGEFRPLTPTEVGQLLSVTKLEPTHANKPAKPAKPAKRPTAARRPQGSTGDQRSKPRPTGRPRATGKPSAKPTGKPTAKKSRSR